MANKGLLGFNADLTWRCLKSLKFLGSSAPRGTRYWVPDLKSNQPDTLRCHPDPKCRTGCALIFELVRERPMLTAKNIEPGWSGPIAEKGNFQHE